MKRYINLRNLIIAITIATCFFGFWNYVISGITVTNGSTLSSISGPENSDTAFGGILFTLSINDSLPHYKYKAIEDSFKNINTEREIENNSENISGTFNTHFGIGTIKKESSFKQSNIKWKKMIDSLNEIVDEIGKLKDSGSIKILEHRKDEIQNHYNNFNNSANTKNSNDLLYYFALNNYSIDYDSKFYMHNGTYHLLYIIWGKYVKNENGDSSRNGTYASKPIKIRYNTKDKRVLVPLTYSQYEWAEVLFYLYSFIIAVIGLYVFLIIPVQILFSISKGRAFTESNILMLRQMAFVILFFAFWDFFLPFVLHFIFRDKLTEDFQLPSLLSRISNMFFYSLLSIPFFIISIAFKRGHNLQQEQDLTI